ncbi:polysaccharide pyruvyl transferase family protein [bacterium]|nr:polysaccharide pyruvyl transferase family protein [bacterium]
MCQVIITNTTLQNGGDAGIVLAMTQLIQRAWPHATIVGCEDSAPENVTDVYPDWQLASYVCVLNNSLPLKPVRLLVKGCKLLRLGLLLLLPQRFMIALAPADAKFALRRRIGVHIVIGAGGTYLTNRYSYLDKLMNLAVAQIMKQKTVFFTQSIDRLDGFVGGAFARHVLNRADLILLRDSRSAHNLGSIGVSNPAQHIVADCAFALADLTRWQARQYPQCPKNIAISVRDCSRFQDAACEAAYRSRVAVLCTWLVREHGATITFISTCQGLPLYRYDDSFVALGIVSSLPADVSPHVAVDRAYHTPTHLQSRLGEFDLIIATRMHSAILGLNAGTPVIPIAYEFKTSELWRGFGLTTFCLHLSQGVNSWQHTVARVLNAYLEYRDRLAAVTAAAHASATNVISLLQRLAI